VKKIDFFNFIVKRFSLLKSLPLLPHVFDAAFKIWQVVIGSKLRYYIDSIEAEVREWDKTSVGLHKYGGLQFNYQGKEIGHLHSNGLLDIRFSRAIKIALLAENRVKDHHVFTDSGWISFYIRNVDDKEYAVKLLQMAYLKMQNH
jgi:hypothetical protein